MSTDREQRLRVEVAIEAVLDAVLQLASVSPNETAELVESIEKVRRALDGRRPALALLQLSHVFTVAAAASQRLERTLSREARVDG